MTDKGTVVGWVFTDTVSEEGGTAEDHGAAHAKALGTPKRHVLEQRRENRWCTCSTPPEGGSEDRRVRTELCRAPEAAEEVLDLG